MANPITINITNVTASGGNVNIYGTYDQNTAYGVKVRQVTIESSPVTSFSRPVQLSDQAFFCLRKQAANVVALPITGFDKICVALEPTLTFAPVFTTQPANQTNAGTAKASGTISGSASVNVNDGDTVTIGTTVYRFKNTMAAAFDIQIGGSGNSDTSLANLALAINGTGTPGTNYFAGTTTNTQVSAGTVTAHNLVITALLNGLAGNNIATTKSSSVISWGASTLTGGTDSATSFTVVVNSEVTFTYQWQYSANGSTGWTNASGTVNGTTYSGGTTATLTCTPTTTGQTGYWHRCVATQSVAPSLATTSAKGQLTVS